MRIILPYSYHRGASLLIICFILLLQKATAQNDDCPTASTIIIPNGGFALGLYTSTQYDLTGATLQAGETFAPSIVVAGLNKKSIWYKFTLPTTRAARISLAQPGSVIQAGNVGFAVYKSNACMPGTVDISTKFSPIEIFGSSFHPCVDAGDYLVQVTSNLNANGPIFITLELDEPTPALYDKPGGAYQFTNINTNKTTVHDFLVQCQTINDAAENCLPNTSFKDFTKSTWHTFTTPAYFDWFNVLLGDINNPSNPSVPKYTVGYRLYEGDSKTTPVGSLLPQGGCDSLRTNGYYYDYKTYRCGELKPNTTYTVQLLYHRDNVKTMRLSLAWNGTVATKAPQPLASLPTPNNIGVLPANPNGIITNINDNFGCNSRHSLYSCPKTMPANGVLKNGYRYNLSTFFSFKLSTSTTVSFDAYGDCRGGYLMRLYKQGLTNNCADLDTANLKSSFFNGQLFQCLDSGDYVLQVMGKDTLEKENYYFGNFGTSTSGVCLNASDLGRQVSLRISAKTEVVTNRFSLSATGKFDKINANGAGVMQPLQRGVTYTATPDTLGCANTVMPDDEICKSIYNEVYTKASYREFTVADSFLLYVPDYLSSAKTSKLYKGDAGALATSQSAFAFPQKITGLEPYSGCFYGYSSGVQNACIVPGTYTFVNFDTRLGYEVSTKFTILQPVAKYNTPAKAQDMGDVWKAIDPVYSIVTSGVDTFTCHDNPVIIDGLNPCAGIWAVPSTKLSYRQFYLSKPAIVAIFNSYGFPYYKSFSGSYSLFSGKATDGLAQLKSMGTKWTCFTNASSSQCDALSPGWYTVVCYGVGPSYANPLPGNPYNVQYSDAGRENGFYIRLSPACPQPKFNRPLKASIDTLTGQPYKIEWKAQPSHTAAYPVTSKKYILNAENFDCSQDTAFINNSMVRCSANNVKVSFYVFQLTQESYVQVGTLPYDFVMSMYNFDVRTNDSVRLKTDAPLQPCLSNNKVSEFCKLQPGFYTLVIFGSAVYSSSCISITPTIYVDQVGGSRFDHASNAYDFGTVIADSTWRNGKPGDVNALDATRAPSNDFFYCTTGAQKNDPSEAACMSLYNPNIYKAGNNVVLHPDEALAPNQYTIDRRNLWYTFSVNLPGKIRIRVKNKTPNKSYQYPFAVYKSDVDGSLPFAQVVSGGQVDSTLGQGLTYVTRNHNGGQASSFCQGPDEIEILIPACSFTPTRYYVVIENRNTYGYEDVYAMNPNSQVEVSLLFDSITANPPKFDHFSQANDLGLVNSGIKKGAVDNFTCATRDLPDPLNYNYVSNCNKTLWYKFTTTVTGQIRYAAFFKNANQYYYDHIQLFQQIKPNDSSSTGLLHLLYTTTYSNNGSWAQRCISPGTYYIILPGCNALDEDVYPQIEIIPQDGDFCSAPMITNLNGPGSRIVPVTLDCHTIGTDYGEFNPTLTCPANASTTGYKTSWYRLDITGTDTLDVTVFINENTNATSTDIKYRMMTGSCGAMQEQSCVQDALTRNTYKCLAPGNSYYIQVFTPVSYASVPVTGTVDLNLSAIIHADTCLPANNCIGVANFTPKFDCNKNQSVQFTNFSTYGSSITYNWDFGYNNKTSNAVSPSFFYPALTTAQTYTVKLVITNTLCGKKDSSIQTITIPARPSVNLGRDTINCSNGVSVSLNASSHAGSTYYWYNGSTQPTLTVGGIASPWVEITYNGCKARDTVNIWINPIAKQPLQTKALCNVTTVVLNASRGQGEQYSWNTGAITSSITVAQPGYYWVDLYLNGCTVRDSFLIVNADLKPLGSDVSICQRSLPYTANATVNGASSYKWQNNSTAPTFSVTQPGLYWVEIGLGGCTFRDTLLVAVDSFKTAAFTARICQGQVYTLASGQTLTAAGVYKDTLRNARGCDSLVSNVTLRVDTVSRRTSTASICTGQTFSLPSGVAISQGGIYRDTVRYTTGCDSLVSTLNLTVNSVTAITRNSSTCQGQLYLLPSGQMVSTAGTYVDTVRNGGLCDSIITTVLAVKTVAANSLSTSICQGQTYTLPSGLTVGATGIYRDTLRYATGCDSLLSTINLTVKAALSATVTASICEGQFYTLPSGIIVTAAGVYRDTVRYTVGCDSLRTTIDLSIKSLTRLSNSAAVCGGQTFSLPSGRTVNSSGIYNDTLHYAAGCDSVIHTINLTVKTTSNISLSPTICQGQTYTLPSGSIVTTTGIYRDTMRYATGCDSLLSTINLTVKAALSSTVTASICEGQSYTLPSGVIITAAGRYMDTVRYLTGCDSLRTTIDLSIKSLTRFSTTPSVCAGQSYSLPSGKVVNSSGIYSDTLRYGAGCDSVIQTINLTVKSLTKSSASQSVCAGQNYTLPWGPIVSAAGVYTDTVRYISGCDSLIRTVTLKVEAPLTQSSAAIICSGQNFTLPWGASVSAGGFYRDTVRYLSGCDSLIRSILLTVNRSNTVLTSAAICAGQSYVLPWGNAVSISGIYRDTLRYTSGCDSLIRQVNLTVRSVAAANSSASICSGQLYTLPWGTAVSAAGVYRDTLRYASGCDSLIRTIDLKVTAPASTTANAAICSNETYALPWGRVVNTSGTYRDTLKTAGGCDSLVRIVYLTVNPQPFVQLTKSNDVDCILGTARLAATGGASYLWSPAVSLSNATVANPVATPVASTMYKVVVTTPAGCVKEDSLFVTVAMGNPATGYLVPSAFTPNNDGKNDCFGVSHWGNVTDLEVSIFSRWGHLLFYTANKNVCWDGELKGVKQKTDVYVYVIKAKTICGPVLRKGTVTLIR